MKKSELKFLIVDGKIRIDTVHYHRELLKANERHANVNGGGICEFRQEDDQKWVELWWKSYDFGVADPDETIRAINNTPEFMEILEMKGNLFFGDSFNLSEWPIYVYGKQLK